MSARTLRSKPINFKPTFKVVMATNHKPKIRGMDQGIWRRIHLVSWDWNIPADEQDHRFGERLAAESAGILAWIVRGAVEWHADGLQVPAKVSGATAEYRSAMDVFASFLSDECTQAPDARVGAAELHDAYKAWAAKTGERDLSQRAIGLRLGERGFRPSRSTSGPNHGRTVWLGIGLLVMPSMSAPILQHSVHSGANSASDGDELFAA